MSERDRGGGVSRSEPQDIILVDGDNNNGHADSGHANNDVVEESVYIIGEPAENFSIHQSVFYSHFYYKKLRGKDGNPDPFKAQCLMCLEKEKKEVLLKITDNNTKGSFRLN